MGLLQQIFPTYVLVGWYLVSQETDISTKMVDFHRGVAGRCRAPIFLLLNPCIGSKSKQLPIHTFEWNITDNVFVELSFRIQSLESERIAADEVFDSFPVQGISTMEAQNDSLSTALETMSGNIKILISL